MASGRKERSRNGCWKCKQRKVRCGEQKPVCSACHRLSLDCEYFDGGKLPPRPPISTNEHSGRARRPHYMVRFVDCTNTTAEQVNGPANTQNYDSHDKEFDDQFPISSSLFDNTSPQDSGNTRANLSTENIDRQGSDNDPASQGAFLGCKDGEIGVPENQQVEQGMVWMDSAEPVLQFFFGESNPTFTSDVTMQFFDSFDHTFWSEPLLDAVGDWAQDGQGDLVDDFRCTNFDTPVPSLYQDNSPSRPQAQQSDTSSTTTFHISTGDHSLIAHFLTRMKPFSTKLLRRSEEDINCAMFSKLGLFNSQLFHAMLAFAALHRAQTQDNLYSEAEIRYQRATALLFEDEKAHGHLDVTILTVWFLLQYELLLTKGIKRFCNLLSHLAHVLDNHPSQNSGSTEGLGNFEARTLISIAAYDLRALTSAGNGGHFLRSLENFLPLRVLLNEPGCTFDGGGLASASISVPPGSKIDHNALLRLRLRCNILHGRILMLSPLRRVSEGDAPLSEDHQEWIAIRKSLAEQHEIFERCPESITGFPVQVATGKMLYAPRGMGSRQCTQLLALSSLYAAFLDYHHAHEMACSPKYHSVGTSTSIQTTHNPKSYPTVISKEESSARMVRIAWFVRDTRKLSPQSVWPSLLFAAGVTSVDAIHRAWVLNALKETETWATHFLKTGILLEAVYKNQAQLKPGEVVDIIHLQGKTTGPFVL